MDMPAEADALLAGINRWVAIESKTDDAAGVAAMIEAAEADFRAAGLAVRRIPGRDGFGDHLAAGASWGGDEVPGILVLCHLDTVHPRGTLEANPIRSEGERAYGPGIYDMKGGVYIALAAAGALVAAGRETPLPLRFLATSDEEVGSPTSRALIEAEAARAKYVLVVEPARDGGRCVTARKGTARLVVETRGVPAHSGIRHQDGASAVREMAHQVLALEAMTDYARGLTVNVGLIRGGSGVNVVPERCRADVDVRMATPEDGAEAVERIRALSPHDSRVQLAVSGGLNRPPYTRSPEIAALFETARGLAAELGFELEDVATGGGSDGNFTAALAPTLDGLGVDGAGAHTLDEHLLIPSLVPRMNLLRRLFETLS